MKRLAMIAVTLVLTCATSSAAVLARPVASQRALHRPAASSIRVGLVAAFTTNDKGFNALALKGLKQAKKQLHVKTSTLVAFTTSDFAPDLDTFAQKKYNLIIAMGALFDHALWQIAVKNPKVHFAIVDGEPTNDQGKAVRLPNVNEQHFRTEQNGYVVGVIAGLMEKDRVGAAKHNTIGVLGGLPIPFVNSMMCGYYAGARSVDKKVKLAWDYANSFTDPSIGQSYGEKQVAAGADILFQIADAAGLGYFKAAQASHRFGIGFAADQDYLGHYVLTSALVRVDLNVLRVIKTQVDGKFRPGSHFSDLNNAGIGYATDMNHVTAKIKKTAAKVANEIRSRKIKVSPSCSLPKSA